MSNSDMDAINALFRSELEKFKTADEAVKQKVVETIQQAGGLDWLIEVCENDDDPGIQEYAAIAQSLTE